MAKRTQQTKTENWAFIASAVIRDRIVASSDFSCAYDLVCKCVLEKTKNADVKQMKKFGGFSKIINDAIENLPPIYHENRGSKMIYNSIVQILRSYVQDIRITVQTQILFEKETK